MLSDSSWIKLPTPVNRFVGRHLELMGLQRALDTSRLVMLSGAAGVGKTRSVWKLVMNAAIAIKLAARSRILR